MCFKIKLNSLFLSSAFICLAEVKVSIPKVRYVIKGHNNINVQVSQILTCLFLKLFPHNMDHDGY